MSTDRQATLKLLLRAIALSVGDFALLLARCNSIEVRDRLVADLKAQLGSGLYDRHVTDADGVVNLVDILDEVGEGTQVISVTGLEASPHLHDILALANNAREEFRKRFQFPLVLWVTDEVDAQLRRRSPDLASWAAPPFDFALERAELQAMLERETADVLDWAFAREGKRGIGQELQWAWQEWQRLEEKRSPELSAKVALAFGIEAGSGDAAREHFENCLKQVKTGSLVAAACYRLGLWWQLRGKQERVNFLVNCDRAREQLQMAWQELEGKQASVALALGEILLALALPETAKATQWEALANFANELVILPDWAAGLRAEVAIARQDWQVAKTESEKALQGQDRQGFYLLSLGRALIGMNQAKEAITPLERAKALVLPEVDPDLHIRILQALHRAYTAVGNYRDAFTVKCDRESVETSYGFRAFIGAGRLQPQRRVGAIGEDAMEEVAASGRQTDIEALVDWVKRSDCRLTVVHGPSGVGKSSLLQSGLVPALRKVIHQSRSVQPVVIEHYEDWQGELASKLGRSPLAPLVKGGKEEDLEVPLYKGDLGGSESLIAQLRDRDRQNLITVLIFDQFEEFFFKHTEVPARRKLYDFLRECLAVPYVWVILSLREDYIHYLLECDRLANIELINNDILNKNVRYYLGNFSKERAKAVIKELTERSPYRLEEALVDRLVADLAAEFGEVRPIELQVVGAQMLHGEAKITTLAAYEGLGNNPKRALVEGWLMQVVRDCGQENEELAQRVLYALTEEPEKRPAKTRTDLQRDVLLDTPELPEEQRDFAVQGDLDFVLTVPIGSGLSFEIPANPEAAYQLIHDYLVQPIRQQFGTKLSQQLDEERKKRKEAEENLSNRNRLLLRGSILGVAVIALGIIAAILAVQSGKVAEANQRTMDTFLVSQKWKQLMDGEGLSLEAQVATIEKAKEVEKYLQDLAPESRLEITATLHRQSIRPKGKIHFEKHLSTVTSVVFSPDSKSVLTGSKDKTAKLWSLDGQLIKNFDVKSEVNSIAFTPDNKGVLTGSADGSLKLWTVDGKLIKTFQENQSAINSVGSSLDGKSVLAGSADGSLKLWTIDGNLIKTFQEKQPAVNSVAFAPDSNSILSGSADGTTKLWSLEGKLIKTFQIKDYQFPVSSVTFSPDGKSVLVGHLYAHQNIRLWSLDGNLIQIFYSQFLSSNVVFSPDGKSILSTSYRGRGRVSLRKLEGGSWSPERLIDHKEKVNSVAISPDGKSFLTGSDDKTVKLWNMEDIALQDDNTYSSAVAFSPDGKSFLTGSGDKTAKLWNLEGKLIQTFKGHQSEISCVTYAPDGNSILTNSADGTAKLWDLDGTLRYTFQKQLFSLCANFAVDGKSIFISNGWVERDKPAKLLSLQGELIRSFEDWGEDFVRTIAPDLKSAITESQSGIAKLWSLDDGRLLKSFEGFGTYPQITFAPDGKSILTIDRRSENSKAKLWSIDNGKSIHTFEDWDSVYQVAFSLDSKSILNWTDGTGKLWDLDGKLLQTFEGWDSVQEAVFAPDGNSILTGGSDGTVKLWNRNGELLKIVQGGDVVYSIAFSPATKDVPSDIGKIVVTGSANGTIKILDRDGIVKKTFQGHKFPIYSIAFAPDGKTFLTGSWDKTAKLWNIDGTLLKTYEGHKSAIFSVAFSPDGNSILTGSADNTAKLWNINGTELQTLKKHKSPVYSVAFSPDGSNLITGSADKTAILWGINGTPLKTYEGHKNRITSTAFTPYGKSVMTGSSDGTAKLWSLEGTRELMQTFTTQEGQAGISSIAFAYDPQVKDSKSVLIGSIDGTIKWWSLDRRELETITNKHQNKILNIAFAPDGKSVLTGSADLNVKLWNLDLGNLLSVLCNNVSDFAKASNKPNIPDPDLRERARKACESFLKPPQ